MSAPWGRGAWRPHGACVPARAAPAPLHSPRDSPRGGPRRTDTLHPSGRWLHGGPVAPRPGPSGWPSPARPRLEGQTPRPGGGATSHAVLGPHTASCSEGPGPNLRSGNLKSLSASQSLGPPAARGRRLLTVPSRGHHCLPRHEATTPGSCRLPPCGAAPSPEPETSSFCNTLPPVLPDPSFGVFKAHSNPG